MSFRWFIFGYVAHVWVNAALQALGDWWDRRRRHPAHIDGTQRVDHKALQQMREADNRLLDEGADYA